MLVEVETVTEVTQEIYAAVCRLVRLLGAHKPIPSREDLTALVESESSMLLVARTADDKSQITGMLALSIYRVPTGIRSVVEDVVVDGSFRRQGVARALLGQAILRAKEAGARNMSLTSRPDREAANQLYLSMGFQKRETNAYSLALE